MRCVSGSHLYMYISNYLEDQLGHIPQNATAAGQGVIAFNILIVSC